MENTKNDTLLAIKELERHSAPANFTEGVMQALRPKGYQPLLSNKIIIFVFTLFFVPPVAMLFFAEPTTVRFAYASTATRWLNGIFQYQQLEVIFAIGVILFWFFLLIDRSIGNRLLNKISS